jgi:hypothetical protein
MDADAAAADPLPQAAFAGPGSTEAGAQAAVTELYLSNALGLVRSRTLCSAAGTFTRCASRGLP